MSSRKEEPSCMNKPAFDLISAVEGLHGLSLQELNKLIKDSENNIMQWTTENGLSRQIDVEKLAKFLALHLIAKLISSELDEKLFKYLVCGFRLLHSLCDLASRHPKLEQILLDDVKISEQLLDLIFYMLIVLGGFAQEGQASSHMVLLHSALVACSLYLLTVCISSQFHELAQVLLAHPKGDLFMTVAFAAVRVDIQFLQIKLSAQFTDSCMKSGPARETLTHLCQHCEASLQFLQSLCQQKLFRERLVKNKELCGKGGVLFLAHDILKLHVLPSCEETHLVAAVSRLKSKVLSILLHLCEAESVSYLDEVASNAQSLDVAKSIALEVLELLKTMFGGDLKELSGCSDKTYPRGLLQLNALRLADIFSDDSNFRSYITIYFTEVLTTIFSLPHGEFLSTWCSSDLPVWEEDVTLEYDSLAAAGWVLDLLSLTDDLIVKNSEVTFNPCHISRASYAHQRTSLLVKVIANLHCFVPDLCKEDKDLFLNKFLQCLQKEIPKLSDRLSSNCGAEKAATISRNLRSLLSHAESLIPVFLNEDDVQLLRVFISQLEPLIAQESKSDRVHEPQNRGGCSLPLPRKSSPNAYDRSGNLNEGLWEDSALEEVNQLDVKGNSVDQSNDIVREDQRKDKTKPGSVTVKGGREIDRDAQNVETSGSDSSTMRQKNAVDQMDNVEFPKSVELVKEVGFGGIQEDEKVENVQSEEKQLRKRKRTIMNDKQLNLIEKALLEEPDMQRKAASIQAWADKLSLHGSEVTTSQLKNWLNNRKARLARAAAKDIRAPSGGDNPFYDKQGGSAVGPLHDSPESPDEDFYVPSTAQGTHQNEIEVSTLRLSSNETLGEFGRREPGQYVMIVDGRGEEIGKGYIHLVNGTCFGRNLEELGLCVVDITNLKVDRWTRLPHPCEATGNSFGQAENLLGRQRVLWDYNKLFLVQPR